ncbi:MAG: GNAT family N-acetyltransferase [Candidatus Limivicinus sp.]|jgi:L-amino acid N-acyltransferase YncA
MNIKMKEMDEASLAACTAIWNTVVEEGAAFPQKETLSPEEGRSFFATQSYCGAAFDEDSGEVVGMYILHPNNVGRCGHICNASYAVKAGLRGQHIGEYLVKDCIAKAGELGFRILQFNAVVSSNTAALKLYKKLGFIQLGVIPGGFCNKKGEYEDIIPHYILL